MVFLSKLLNRAQEFFSSLENIIDSTIDKVFSLFSIGRQLNETIPVLYIYVITEKYLLVIRIN